MTTSKPRKQRAREPLNADTLQPAWDSINAERYGEDYGPINATDLGRTSRSWRKLLSYLREPAASPQHIEAQTMLVEMGIIHAKGEFNSRTLLDENYAPDYPRLFEDYKRLHTGEPVSTMSLAAASSEWAALRVVLLNPESYGYEDAEAQLKRSAGITHNKGLTVIYEL